jgi:hypothetical protein
MSNIHKLPACLDQQGRYKTRDTTSRQIAAEQAWAQTCWQPTQIARSVPLKRTEKRLSRSKRAWIIVGCCALAWFVLMGLAAVVLGVAFLVAAMVAA